MINERDDNDNLNAEKIPVRLTPDGGQLLMITMMMMVVTTMFTKMVMTMIITLLCNPFLFSPGGDCSTCISLGHQQVCHRHQIDQEIKQL